MYILSPIKSIEEQNETNYPTVNFLIYMMTTQQLHQQKHLLNPVEIVRTKD